MKLPVKEHLAALERIPNASDKRRQYLHLEKNENLIPFPNKLLKEFQKEITADFISSYPELTSLYERISKWIGCGKDNIYMTAGSDAAIKTVFEVFVSPGDKVTILYPTYAMYYVYAHMFQAQLLRIDCKEDLSYSSAEILRCLRAEWPKLICIANPNSPTGTILAPRELEKIIKTAEKYSTLVLVDEAYHFYHSKSVIRLIKKYQNLIVTRTFSKALGLASARVGFIIGTKEMINALFKVRPMYEVNAIGAKFVEKLLDHPETIRRNLYLTLESKRYLERELDKTGIPYFKSWANFILIDVGSFEESARIVKEMKKRNILINGQYKHRWLKNCIRVTVGTKEQMGRFLKELKQIIMAGAGNEKH